MRGLQQLELDDSQHGDQLDDELEQHLVFFFFGQQLLLLRRVYWMATITRIAIVSARRSQAIRFMVESEKGSRRTDRCRLLSPPPARLPHFRTTPPLP